MIPLDRLLAHRRKWEKMALALFLAAFSEEMEAVAMVGESEITPDRWVTALLAVGWGREMTGRRWWSRW
jgi:hypothetical protein